MSEWTLYKRISLAFMRELRDDETLATVLESGVSVSGEDRALSPSVFHAGRIARNPDNEKDQWYISPDVLMNMTLEEV